MGIETKSGIAAPEVWLADLFGASSAVGINVNPRSAMGCAPVRAAVTAISEPIGTLPMILYRRSADGSKERATDHPVHKLLHDQINDFTSASSFREYFVTATRRFIRQAAWPTSLATQNANRSTSAYTST